MENTEKSFLIKDTERTDDLGAGNVRIIISNELPRFTSDAVLLAKFAAKSVNARDTVADLGSGTGILALMIHGMTGAHAKGFEIQSELCDMSNRSAQLNGIEDKVEFYNMDFNEAYREFNGAFTAGVCNPPYFSTDRGLSSPDAGRQTSRAMKEDGIDEVARAAARLIRTGGRFFMCYPVDALVDAVTALRNVSLEPKRIRFIKSTENAPAYLALIESRRGGGRGLSVETHCLR